jgi:tripartite-type tricarboxylate transporter receptor subunit TctC
MIIKTLVLVGLKAAIVAAFVAVVPRAAAAETWPAHPITMVVPFPAGGPTDALARIISEPMSKVLGQSVVVDNVSGAGGTIGVAKVARGAADGYALSVGQTTSNVFSVAVYSVPYDVLADLAPVALLSSSALMMVGRHDLPANNLKELIAWMKASRQPASYATVGVGSPGHVWSHQFEALTGARVQLIPYRGLAPAMQDLVAGRIDLSGLEASSSLPYVLGGKIKAFGTLTAKRWAGAPDIPTLEEQGLEGLVLPYWTGVWVRQGTPVELVKRLNAAVVAALNDPAIRKRLTDIGQEIPTPEQQTPEALGALHRAAIDKWWPIIKAANIRAE